MPRWKALPDELDPQIKEFAGQLRRLVDRSELSIAALADATGYSKSSWEKYLNGRLLAPKGAIVALAEVTRTNPVHLTTLWELAERAWSRSEMRHDMTMEAIRISQARAALGDLTAPQSEVRSGKGLRAENRTESRGEHRADKRGEHRAEKRGEKSGAAGRGAGGAVLRPGVAGPAGVAPTVPPVPAQPTPADSQDRAGGRSGDGSGGGNSWNIAGYRGPAPAGPRAAGAASYGAHVPGPGGPGGPGGPARPARDATVALGVAGEPGTAPVARPRGGPPPDGRAPGRRAGSGGRRLTTFVVSAVGVLVVAAGAFFLLDGGDDEKAAGTRPSPSPTATTGPALPAGVKCGGDQCAGKDAEAMGCGGDLVTTERTATVGTALVEVRYSKICGTAWGRVTQAGEGDEVTISAGGDEQTGSVTVAGDTIAYTPMVAVGAPADAKACVLLASGEQGCTE
ncbi:MULTISPECIES: helix-turn-helix domain-containing protein [Streptomyces]|jgi:hypothetical protein|uniref:HTH cro/C1-type domain-containing protein n=2 Tax=Streptomyces TaxID=1883 RepID=A0ABT9LKZ6_STRGD|nr:MULTISPECIES: XRE family transcriptional regulator [Streptomyces]MDP9683647.1 hypothetical protein [Streptomyces griseoviridis]GGS93391.1 hypothetical protein GCM10010240_28420 [Streptomyces griseoviridis]GGU21974.1 hypothetical protein GCM10010259_10390 [Streptomyces daghestanicus]GHI31405.1 hypothetical protein Sdagh_31350 [Streptomyces daghestanicus]